MSLGYIVAIAFMLLCAWRAWGILRSAPPFWRSMGTVFSGILPFPVFLVVVVYHYASRRASPSTPAVVR